MPALDDNTSDRMRRRRMEVLAFLFLTAVLMPAIAVATVGGYGLTVWIYQIIAGPPGPPARYVFRRCTGEVSPAVNGASAAFPGLAPWRRPTRPGSDRR